MRFFGNLFAWVMASLGAYLAASFAATQITLSKLAALGAPASIGENISTVFADWQGLYLYLLVIALGFLIAFYVASLVKAMLPSLSLIAYPVAGGGAILAALFAIHQLLDVQLISAAQSELGMATQIFAGVLGGAIFEWLRPKD